MDSSLFDARFILILLHTLFASAIGIFLTFTVRYAEQIGMERSQASLVLSFFGVGHLAGFLYSAACNANTWTQQHMWHRFRVPELMCLELAACCILTFLVRGDVWQMAVGGAVGVAAGLQQSSLPGLVIECCGRERLSVTWGFLLLAAGMSRMLLLPLAGE